MPTKYDVLPQGDSFKTSKYDRESVNACFHDSSPGDGSKWHRFRHVPRYSSSNLLLSHLIVLLTLYLPFAAYMFLKAPSWVACDEKLETWASIRKHLRYKHPELCAGKIVQTNKFRGPTGEPPTPEIDGAWKEIGVGVPGLRLTDEDLVALNKSDRPGMPLHRIPNETGGGYLGMLEVFHQLHCLNSLRQAMFYNWQYYDNGAPLKQIIIHHDHCIDVIRMSLMCNVDVTPVTFYDDETKPWNKLPLPDFSIKHICRDFDAIVGWSWKNPKAVLWEDIGDAATFTGAQHPTDG